MIVRKEPVKIVMTLDKEEAQVVILALKDAHEKYRDAAEREKWLGWANEIENFIK